MHYFCTALWQCENISVFSNSLLYKSPICSGLFAEVTWKIDQNTLFLYGIFAWWWVGSLWIFPGSLWHKRPIFTAYLYRSLLQKCPTCVGLFCAGALFAQVLFAKETWWLRTFSVREWLQFFGGGKRISCWGLLSLIEDVYQKWCLNFFSWFFCKQTEKTHSTNICVYIYICIHTYMHVYTCIYLYIYIYIRIHVYEKGLSRIYACVHRYVYTWI